MSTGEAERVLITVKTYPHPSEKYDELVCTAGVTEAGEWVRLYPINYRGLDYERQFAKYQWVEIELGPAGHGNDNRRESRRPNLDTLALDGDVLSTKNNWRARKAIIDKMPVHTLNELCGRKRDTLFFMGTTWPFNTWITLGVFYPERDAQLPLI